MNIEITGRRMREAWDPAEAAGELGMAADFQVEDVAPDKDGKIKIVLNAAGENDALLQGIEIELDGVPAFSVKLAQPNA